MNHKNVLTRAWHVLWRYKALWLFGVLLALTSVSGWWFLLNDNDDNNSVYRGLQINLIPSH